MKNVSAEFKNQLNEDNRCYIKTCDIALIDGTVLHIADTQIWNNGFKIEDAVSNNNSFDIGAAIIGKFTLVINNIYDEFSDYDFAGAVISNIKVGLKLPDGTVESVKEGVFTVDEPNYNGSIITLECLDNMSKFDRPYSESNLVFPAALGTIVRDACNCCGVSLAADSAVFENSDFVVDVRPDDRSLTFRQVLSWVGQISCHWCRCNESGQLSLGWYNLAVYEKETGIVDAGTIGKPAGNAINAGTFDNPALNIVDAGTFAERNAFHHIYSISSMNIITDDVVITGIRVVAEEIVEDENGESTEEDVSYQVGTDGYVLSIEDNELIQGTGAKIAEYLGNKLIGLRFRPLSVNCLSNPTIEAGDMALISDRKGRTYPTLITSTTFSSGNYQQVSCDADSPARNSAARYSETARIYQELRKKLKRNKTEWEKAVDDLANALASSSGLYITTERQEDGSSIYYMHNKTILAESDIVWKLTAEAFGISTDGGKTYPFGFKVTGEMITRILNTIGINAGWINTGTLAVKDAVGNVMFLADMDTGRVDINARTLKIQGLTVEQIAEQKTENIINEVAGDLQTQIDGKIQSYDQATDPSKSWAFSTYANHTGDIWKNGDNLYRWNGTKWTEYGGNDAVARKLAESKATIFGSTPVPPYKANDMWVTSTENGKAEYKICVKTRTTGSFVSTDWIAPRYTDDTAVNNLDKKLNSTEELFNRLTQNGKIKGIYLENGQLFISFTYAKGGELVLGGVNNGNGSLKILDSRGNIIGTIDNAGIHFNEGEINGPEIITDKGIIAGMTLDEKGFRYGYANWKDYGGSNSVYFGKYGMFTDNGINQVAFANGGMHILRNGSDCGYIASGDGYNMALYNYGLFDNQGRVVATVGGNMVEFKKFTEFASGYEAHFWGSVRIDEGLKVSGSKSRLVKTRHYGERLQYCYETATPFFGDMGCGRTDESGECIVQIDDVFLETVGAQEYHVFLQEEGEGKLYVRKEDKYPGHFIVRGTPELDFSWEVKCRQAGYEYERLDTTEQAESMEYPDETEEKIMAYMAHEYQETEDLLWQELTDLQA